MRWWDPAQSEALESCSTAGDIEDLPELDADELMVEERGATATGRLLNGISCPDRRHHQSY